jgi:hypothetical protein
MDLGSLAGPSGYSSVVWPVKNNSGLISGITQTSLDDPNDENWSCSSLSVRRRAENITGNTCVGFAWQDGQMRPLLPTLGGPNGFRGGANNRGQITGWAETNRSRRDLCRTAGTAVPSGCLGTGIRRRHPASADHWRYERRRRPGINDRGEAIGISGKLRSGSRPIYSGPCGRLVGWESHRDRRQHTADRIGTRPWPLTIEATWSDSSA